MKYITRVRACVVLSNVPYFDYGLVLMIYSVFGGVLNDFLVKGPVDAGWLG